MPKMLGSKHQHMRERIAQLAARLIAEDGIGDYALAKRKAARQIGAADTQNLPANSEIEQALRIFQNLYQKEEQAARVRELREQALVTMRLLERFNPCLTGEVLSGTAARHSGINLHLFAESIKEVELFLLNRQMEYRQGEKYFHFGDMQRSVPTLTLTGGEAPVELAVFAVDDSRQSPRSPVDGKPMERIKIRQVEGLLERDGRMGDGLPEAGAL